MAVFIDVITGFLESGKTTFIKDIINKNCLMEYQKTVLIICEEGFTEYDEEQLSTHKVELISINDNSQLNELFFQNIYQNVSPEHIIIEFNGTWDITSLLCLKLPFTYQFRNIIFISDACNFQNYLGNMASLLQPQILNSDIVLFNRQEGFDKKQKKVLLKDIKNINKRSDVIFSDELSNGHIISRYLPPHEKYVKISTSTKIAMLLLVCSVFFSNHILLKLLILLQSMATIFLSILIEAIPFVLLGAFISSILQLMVPSGWIIKKFTGNKYRTFFIASIAGLFMPICDCGTVPIVSGLLKKEAPFPQTITFWLASSAVNPVVLISVYYAFPDQPYLILIRIITGVFLAIMIGFIFKLSKIETRDIVTKNSRVQNIGSELQELRYEGRRGRIEAVVKGARYEFFRVMKYLIYGAFVSSFLQIVIPQNTKLFLSSNISIQFIVMIVAAMLMSTCSTSNAFIGRSFIRYFSIMPIMSYIVLGPMLDFKNMLMLSEIIKKRYLILLGSLICVSGFLLFYLLSLFI